MKKVYWQAVVILLPITFIWVMLSMPWAPSSMGPLSQLKQIAMNWRYNMRGPMDAVSKDDHKPLKLFYVNFDEATLSQVGEKPWDREVFADAAIAMIGLGKAKAVGFDFIFTPLTSSRMVPSERVLKSDQALAKAVKTFPEKIVLAASYSGVMDERYMQVISTPPYIYEGAPYYSPAYPESPTYPIIDHDRGVMGLINVDVKRSATSIPQWLLMHTAYKGSAFSRNLAYGRGREFSISGAKPTLTILNDELQLLKSDGKLIETYPANTKKVFRTMSLELLRCAYGLGPENVKINNNDITIENKEGKILHNIPLVDKQILEINWFSAWNDKAHNPRTSLRRILDLWTLFSAAQDTSSWFELWSYPEEEQDLMPLKDYLAFASTQKKWDEFRKNKDNINYFKDTRLMDGTSIKDIDSAVEAALVIITYLRAQIDDSIVLVGPTDRMFQDLAPTPFDSSVVPKVGTHGNALKTIYSERYIKRITWQWHVFIILALSIVATLLILNETAKILYLRWGGICLLAVYAIAVFKVFSTYDLVLPLVAPVSSALSVALIGLIWRLFHEEKQKSRITGMFGTYLSHDLVDEMIKSGEEPSLGGEDQTITAFFSDVQGFSALSETLEPKKVVLLMNEYLTPMTDILMEEGCYVDKYIGDAIVGIFNAPVSLENHELRACVASLKMHDKLEELRKKWISEGDKWSKEVHSMHMRIGLHTGHATVGNMGSERRFNYTMMGDMVNLTARLESGSQQYGVSVMVSGETKVRAEKAGDDCIFRFIDKIIVKGRSAPVDVHEIVCFRKQLDDGILKCLQNYERGIEFYLKQEFDKGIDCFEESSKHELSKRDEIQLFPVTPSEVMLDRSRLLLKNPPSGKWNGVYTMKTK